jgi:hypothetical protein
MVLSRIATPTNGRADQVVDGFDFVLGSECETPLGSAFTEHLESAAGFYHSAASPKAAIAEPIAYLMTK